MASESDLNQPGTIFRGLERGLGTIARRPAAKPRQINLQRELGGLTVGRSILRASECQGLLLPKPTAPPAIANNRPSKAISSSGFGKPDIWFRRRWETAIPNRAPRFWQKGRKDWGLPINLLRFDSASGFLGPKRLFNFADYTSEWPIQSSLTLITVPSNLRPLL